MTKLELWAGVLGVVALIVLVAIVMTDPVVLKQEDIINGAVESANGGN